MVPLKLIIIILQSTMYKVLTNKYPFSNLATYTRRGRHRPPLSLTVGNSVSGYHLLHSKYYKDFDLTHLHFNNNDNQSQIHQLECDQQNNTLSMIFKTRGEVKPGMNYALQKLLQCGSKKYPVRNLTQEMTRRSFSRLGQSQTTDDYLMFSFNTPIIKDFNNLFQVYCSMIFDPLMREQDFYQVVRRLTYDEKSLGFTGELAAELYEGQFGMDQLIYSIIHQTLLGEKTQSLCRPLQLLNISYAELMKYYKQTITLPNCTMVLHGDMNISHVIDLCNKNFKDFKAPTHQPIFNEAKQKCDNQKKTVFFEHLKQQTILMYSYKIENATEEELTLLEILSYLLFDMPESPFLKFNSPQTPYPTLYGFHQRYFNVGITCWQPCLQVEKHMETAQTFKKRQKFLLQKEAEMLSTLQELVKNKFNNKMIEKCLYHLQSNYYQKQGIKVIESLTEKIIKSSSLDSAFDVTSLISRLLKTFRKNNIFQNLIQKFILDNPNYITLRGRNNPDIIEKENTNNQLYLAQMQFSLPSTQLQQLQNYSPPNMLQDFSLLPQISPNQLQSFEDLSGENIKIGNVNTVFSPRYHGNKFTFKFDLTDVGEDDIPLLALFCKAFPQMGLKTINQRAYSLLLETYISKLDMNYECTKSQNGQLKIYAYLTIQFTDRNFQYSLSVLTGLLTDFNQNNISALSRSMHLAASNCFNELSEDILHVHGMHLAASKSPYIFFQSPLFQARTLCGLAGQMKKIVNPKGYLMGLASKFNQIWSKMVGWSRVELLWECHPDKKEFYKKHLTILLSQITQEGIPPSGINVDDFPKEKWQKYFPNFQNQLVFQAFSVPYRQPNSPQTLVLSAIINENILNFNQTGGCFLYKGAMVSFLAGTRNKFIELEEYYKKGGNLDVAKRRIFQKFDRYTVENQFKSGIDFVQARNFKEAVLSVQKEQVEKVLNDYVLSSIKEGTSSVLALGTRLQNYDPLMKKGWEIERSIDDLSLDVQSLSKQEIRFHPQRYVDIC